MQRVARHSSTGMTGAASSALITVTQCVKVSEHVYKQSQDCPHNGKNSFSKGGTPLKFEGHVTPKRGRIKQEIPAIADKPARAKSLPKIAPIRRAYNVVADNTGLSSFV